MILAMRLAMPGSGVLEVIHTAENALLANRTAGGAGSAARFSREVAA
jgi:hypothetical protein